MADHPILFKSEMVRAILDGRKTQTRRIINPQPTQYTCDVSKMRMWEWRKGKGRCAWAIDMQPRLCAKQFFMEHCPYGIPGDLLWVRETTNTWWRAESSPPPYHSYRWTEYRADGKCIKTGTHYFYKNEGKPEKWKPSIFMPKDICRLWLKVKSVRVERVQEMRWQECKAEGITLIGDELVFNNQTQQHSLLRTKFKTLWDSINAKPKPRYRTVNGKKEITHYESYPWKNIHQTRRHRGKPWHVYGNPHVFATEFERYEQ